MQLFICPHFECKNKQVIIRENKELVNQLKKVLRAKEWYQFFVQDENPQKRYKLALQSLTNQEIKADILEEIDAPREEASIWMLIALPNKMDKLELIIQKLTEIGVSDIYLFQAERSLLKTVNENKQQRLKKIIYEAVEQSRAWTIPQLHFVSDLKSIGKKWQIIIFDITDWKTAPTQLGETCLWVIWPEGGLTPKDYEKLPNKAAVISLGKTVLRMETAAIVGWWYLKNRL